MDRFERIKHEIGALHEDMRSTRVRDGLKMTTYLSFVDRLNVIYTKMEDACEAALAPVPPPPPPTT